MRQPKYYKYKFAKSRKKSSGGFYWLLVLGGLVFVGWLWWRSGHPAPLPVKSQPVRTVVAQPSPPPPAPRTAAATVAVPDVAPPPATNGWPRPARNLFEAQLALVEQGISSGSLDGVVGSQTRAALAAFQQKQHLPVTGMWDAATKEKLLLNEEPYITYTVSSNDLERLQPLATTWVGKSQQTALEYESILELVAEKSFSHPGFIRRLNPGINWTNVTNGTVLQVPHATYPEPGDKTVLQPFIEIHLAGKTLEVFDSHTNLLAHFPCSIAKHVEKRPVGELHVAVVAPNPNYTFDPDIFPESAEARELGHKLVLQPGPNNPVGVAWIGLDKPGYGIHGTPRPEEVGRTESHGCFRLANWNAQYLLRLITVGTPVYVVE